jgi:hypothetical protein
MTISNFLEDELLDCVFNNDVGTLPIENVYVKLHTGDPGEAATSNVAGHTTRVEMTCGAASGGATSNDAPVVFSSLTTNETISHISLWDHVSAGNALWSGALSVSKAVNSGDTLTFATGDIDVTLE